MASQYSLNLKAVLDTTQVKQELQKLRTLQQQALGNNQRRGTTQNTQNLGNLNGLNSTLGKLNASISQLNANIQKLNIFNQKQLQNITANRQAQMSPSYAINPQSNIQRAKRIRTTFDAQTGYTTSEELTYQSRPYIPRKRNIPSQTSRPAASPTSTVAPITADNVRQGAGFGMMAFGQILNAGANYAAATGNTQASKNLQAGGTVAGMAGTGAMVGSIFGPIGTGVGAAIGTVVGGVTAALEYLAQSAQEIAEEMQKYSEMIKEAATIDRDNMLQTKQKDVLNRVESGDIDTLTKRKTALQKEYDDIVKRQNEIVPEGQLEDYAQKFADLKKRFLEAKEESNFVEEWFGLEDAEIEERLRKQYKKEKPQFEKNYEEYSDLQKRRQEILQEQQIVEQGLGVLEGRKKSSSSQTSSLGDVLSDLSRNKFIESFSGMSRKDLDEYLKHYEGRVEASKSSYRDNLLKAQEITGVSDSDIKKREDLLKAANASKRDLSFNESVVNEIKRNIDYDNLLNSGIGDERTQIRLFNEAQSNQKTINSENEDDVRQKRDQYKDRADTAKNNYLYYLKKAETAQTPEEKQEAYNIAMQSKKRWEFDKSQFDQLNSSLTQMMVAPLQDALSKLTAPSMENVNSLAGQGLMINRADDAAREQAMEDYEREQTELQRQIKDILQQNETTPKKSIIL